MVCVWLVVLACAGVGPAWAQFRAPEPPAIGENYHFELA
jgi:hypothetical protein